MKTKILFILFSLLLCGCNEEEGNGDDIKNDEAMIIRMSFDFGEVTFEENLGMINAPENTDLKSLTPVIEISEGAVIDPPSNTPTDFTEPVEYEVTSEDQENVTYYTVSVLLPLIKFTVFDCTNRSPENPNAELASDAKISIYKDVSGNMEFIEELTTDDNGEALFYGDRDLDYYILAEKNDASNMLDGYVIVGIFKSQADIDSSTEQIQPMGIGDLKFQDTNGDGKVDENDQVDYQKIWYVPEDEVAEISVFIAEE